MPKKRIKKFLPPFSAGNARRFLSAIGRERRAFHFLQKFFGKTPAFSLLETREAVKPSGKEDADMSVTPKKPPGMDANEERLNAFIALCTFIRWLADQARQQLEKEKALRLSEGRGGNQDE